MFFTEKNIRYFDAEGEHELALEMMQRKVREGLTFGGNQQSFI